MSFRFLRFIAFAFCLSFLSLASQAQIKRHKEFFYPEDAIKNRIQGRVYVGFTALPTGEIVDSTIHVVKGLGYGLDEMAVKAVQDAPPLGRNEVTQLKRNEPTNYTLPILFTIHPEDWANYYYKCGLREYQAGDFLKAIGFYEQSIAIISNNALYHYELYNVFKKIEQIENACSSLKREKRLDRQYLEEWVKVCK
jgi:TonB family protein